MTNHGHIAVPPESRRGWFGFARRVRSRPVVGLTLGVFDFCHEGHLNLLRRAAGMCDRLVVGVHTDEEVRRYKGVQPANSEARARGRDSRPGDRAHGGRRQRPGPPVPGTPGEARLPRRRLGSRRLPAALGRGTHRAARPAARAAAAHSRGSTARGCGPRCPTWAGGCTAAARSGAGPTSSTTCGTSTRRSAASGSWARGGANWCAGTSRTRPAPCCARTRKRPPPRLRSSTTGWT
ncbi:MAG: adenylyltransferase/cytidyltransferase family protein [bacterium]|nr:adenylyltransferase/cytidyltransferase family protein [bacterium]